MTNGTQPAGGAVRVGDFVVDPRSGELRGDAGRQVLSAQPLHLLLALVERPGELITRDELRARLWPSDTYVDFEHGLNAVVKRLRDALGDSADTPRYIETVPRRGYRLLAAVEPLEGPRPKPDAASGPAPATLATRGYRVVPIAGGIALGLAAALSVGHGLIRWRPAEAGVGPPASATRVQPVRLTFGPGLQTDPAWSPDGRRVAYASDREGNFDLFVQSIDGEEPVRLTSTAANETQPAWSPDGTRIVFRSDESGGGVFTIRLADKGIRRVGAVGNQPVWMPDGRTIVYGGAENQTLYLVDAEGEGTPRPILEDAMAGGGWFSFAVHPDGRIGVLGIHPTMRVGFYVSDHEHRTLRSVTSRWPSQDVLLAWLRRAVWAKAGDAVFIEGRASGLPAIWRVLVDPATQLWQKPVLLSTGPAGANHAAISPDGKTIAFTSTQGAIRAWVFPFDADRGTLAGDGHAVTDEDASVGGLMASADGESIYYSENRPGRDALPGIRLQLATGEPTVLFGNSHSGPVPAHSGNGTSYLLARKVADSPNDLQYALAWRSRDGRERLLSRWGAGALNPSDVRRDDQAVLGTWMPTPYSGPAALAEWPIGPSPVTEPRRVLLAGDDLAIWQGRYSPDGRWVSFVVVRTDGHGGLQMGIAPSGSHRASTWTRLASDHRWPDKPRWSPDGRTLYFLSRSSSPYYALWGVRIDPARGVQLGAPFLIKAFDSPRWHVDPDLSGMEMGVAKGVLVLPMRSVRGSIWLLTAAGT